MSVTDQGSPVKTPEWLEILENKRKRPHKLAHEIGAGAPCLVCKDACKGLNLHFWRKLCIECKCRKEDHEVQEEEDYAQFEILFGAKKVKRTTLKFNAQNKSFDWIPPNVPPELAVDYLKSIPQSKLPISNTDGARYRKQQLEKQLPLHDVDPNACHNLSEKEMQEFQKYLDNLKNNVIGQGKIMKFKSPKMLKENYLRGSSPQMVASSEEYGNLKPQGAELRGHLNVEKILEYNASSQPLNSDSYPAESLLNYNSLKYSQPISSSQIGAQPLRSRPLEKNENINFSNQNQTFKPSDIKYGLKPFLPYGNIQKEKDGGRKNDSTVNDQNNLGLRTPSSFFSGKSPINDKQNNNAEIVHQDDNCNENISFPIGKSTRETCHPPNVAYSESLGAPNYAQEGGGNGNYEKVPNDSATQQVSNYSNLEGNQNFVHGGSGSAFQPASIKASVFKNPLETFSGLSISSSEVPFVPVQEAGNISMPKRNFPDKVFNNQLEDQFEDNSNSFPAPPATCQQCLEILYPEEVVVQTERGGNFALWHAKCFVCETCKELLVDLMYFFHKGKVYCGRHYAEMNIMRCYACDELIFVKEYTVAEGQSYHVRHFCCFCCDQPLGGKQYVPKDNNPICLDCYQVKYGKNCQTCSLPIAANEQRVSWQDLDFHVSPQCFRCTKCLKSLLGGRFVVKNNNTFCSKECVQQFVN